MDKTDVSPETLKKFEEAEKYLSKNLLIASIRLVFTSYYIEYPRKQQNPSLREGYYSLLLCSNALTLL